MKILKILLGIFFSIGLIQSIAVFFSIPYSFEFNWDFAQSEEGINYLSSLLTIFIFLLIVLSLFRSAFKKIDNI